MNMTQEEKARAYDAAIERAKIWRNNSGMPVDRKGILDDIFPELQKSEYENIRKWLIGYFNQKKIDGIVEFTRGLKVDNILSWLEKQGKPIDKIVKRAMDEKQRILLTETNGDANIDWDTRSLQDVKLLLEYGLDYIKKLEKKGKHKPTDKVEPKFKVGDTIQPKDRGHEPWQIMQVDILDKKYRFKDGYVIHFSQEDNYELAEQAHAWSEFDENALDSILNDLRQGVIPDDEDMNWLKSLKDRVQPKSVKWSEEDELHIRELERRLKQAWVTAEHGNDKETIHRMSDLSFFLKTLKPQLKQEWSGEGERNIKELLYLVEANYLSSEEAHDRLINFLESLRPQNTWKPSVEHMKALDIAICCGIQLGTWEEASLKDLREQLKEIRL